jgi:hypothetical protein
MVRNPGLLTIGEGGDDMRSLYPNGFCGCPGFAFSVQFRFVQATDEAGVSELRSSTFLAGR